MSCKEGENGKGDELGDARRVRTGLWIGGRDHRSGDYQPVGGARNVARGLPRKRLVPARLWGFFVAQILWRCSSVLPITMRWISEVPSPISSNGASR